MTQTKFNGNSQLNHQMHLIVRSFNTTKLQGQLKRIEIWKGWSSMEVLFFYKMSHYISKVGRPTLSFPHHTTDSMS